ncbi:MAG: glycosyltransferase family 2 protein [Eubacterium sp.]
MTDLVSIIVPVYNSEKYIKTIIKQILDQTYKNIELILVNDGSTDNSDLIIKSFLGDRRIKYISQINSGPSKARNTGLKNVKGQYITFIDSDDSIDHSYIEKLYKGIIEFDSDICCCGYKYSKENIVFSQHDFLPKGQIEKTDFAKMILSGTGGTICSKIYKADIIKNNKILFNEKYAMCEDQLFALNCWEKSNSFCSIDYYGYSYNKNNENSLVNSSNFKTWYEQIELINEISYILNINIDVENAKTYLNNKIKEVIRNLIFFGISENKQLLKSILKEKKVTNLIKILSIDTFRDFIYFATLKAKLNSLTIKIYGLLSAHLKRKKYQ